MTYSRGESVEKLLLRHDKVPAEVYLINCDGAMQTAPASPACADQLAPRCGGRLIPGLAEQ